MADGQRHLHLRRAVRNLRTDQPVTDRHLDGRIGPLGRRLLRLLLLPRLPDRPGGLHREQRAHEYVSQLGENASIFVAAPAMAEISPRCAEKNVFSTLLSK